MKLDQTIFDGVVVLALCSDCNKVAAAFCGRNFRGETVFKFIRFKFFRTRNTVIQKKEWQSAMQLLKLIYKIMKKSYDSRLRMYRATYDVLHANEGTFASYPALLTAYDALNARIQSLLLLKQEQEANRKGYAIDKKSKRFALADAAMKIRGKVSAYAKSINDAVLFAEMKITSTNIRYGKSTSALTLSQTIYDAANAVPAIEKTAFDITPALLLSLEKAIDGYLSAMSSPRVANAERKTQTRDIKDFVGSLSSFLKNEMDGLMQVYDGTVFFADYTNARRIFEEPTLQARVIGTVTEQNGNPVEGAVVMMTNGMHTFEDMTDEKGKYRLRNLNPELYTFKVTKPGFNEYVLPDMDIYAGEHEKLNVEIKAV
jgi:hypothetical protein